MVEILVAGEGLIDFLPIEVDGEQAFLVKPGGSPLNVAVGLRRLGVNAGFLGKLSYDPFGSLLYRYLLENKVDVSFVLRSHHPTALAFVYLREGSEPIYVFYGQETADAQLTFEEIPCPLPTSVKALHFGSLAMIREPCATALTSLLEREHSTRFISFDPNVRPDQIFEPQAYRERFAYWLSMIDLLKLSLSDLKYLAPREKEHEVIRTWCLQGPKLVVITLGPAGARAYTPSVVVEVEAPRVQVVDTVGAGDAFMAGLLAVLHHSGKLAKSEIANLDKSIIKQALRIAVQAAAITCSKKGADMPYAFEVGIF